MLRSIIISVAFLSLPCAAFPPLERDLEDIGPNDVDWNGYYTTSDGEKIYCPEAFREKRKQYAIKKQRERTTNWIIAFAIILPSCAIGYVIYKEKKEKVRRKAEEGRLKQLKEEQERQKKETEQERREKEQLERIRNQGRSPEQKPIIGSPAPQKPANPAPDPPDPKAEQGLAYERHIGYLLEKEGHIVFYRGAYAGEKDKGVDLVALKDAQTRLIQCKCFNNNLPINQVQKYLCHIQDEWENVSDSPIHGLSHTWELYCTSWLSDGAWNTCCNNNIIKHTIGAGSPPLVKAFYFEGKKRYMLPHQQFYDLIISYIDGQNHRRFYKPEDAEKEGFSHLELIDINTANLINQETIQTYTRTHTQTPLETLKRPWLDF